MNELRLNKLNSKLLENSIDGIVLNAGPTLTYFTGLGFHLMERPVVFSITPHKKPILILPELEKRKIEHVTGINPFFYDENPENWQGVFTEAFRFLDLKSPVIGLEPLWLRYIEHNYISQSLDKVEFVDGSKIISTLRSRKDEEEIRLMRKAVEIAQDALRSVLPQIKIGMEEKEIANNLVQQLLLHGSEPSLPFTPIVSSGPNGANPHAKPSSRKIADGELLVIDWGANHQGYMSDLTRTFAVGNIDDESLRIHELVQQANSAGRKAGRAGKTCQEIDRAARRVIRDGGYGDLFTHRTGHGIGRECHEEPYIREGNTELLEPGMTYTIEPGIYIPGKNGVRIEDDVMITDEGTVSLSDFPRRLLQLG